MVNYKNNVAYHIYYSIQAPREKYIAKFDFAGRDPEDLPFRRGDILTILQRDEDQWWTARNEEGDTGLIPVPYVQRVRDSPIIMEGK